ncbi:unnamed protein product [Amaranthus hypochondriacus]
MFAVGRLGSYISRGVYTVSGPFHPFGGAVDIIVVEQEDGSFKSSPWYVRFGKFQGVLKASERVVTINVNGADAHFHMYLDRKGEAFFVREVDASEGGSVVYPSSGDEMEVKSDDWKTRKSMSYNYDANRPNLVSELEGSNRRNLARTNSRRARIFGLPFGRKSMKGNGFQDGMSSVESDSVTSLERAEIAADLLEVRWTTNIRTSKTQNVMSVADNKLEISEGNVVSGMAGCNISSNQETDAEFSCSANTMKFTLEESYMEADFTSYRANISDEKNSMGEISEESNSSLTISQMLENENSGGSSSFDDAALADEVGTSPRCSIGDGFVVDTAEKKDVEVVRLEDSTTEKESSSSNQDCYGGPTMEGSHRGTSFDNLKEEQFLFSDDDSKVENAESKKSSSGSEESFSQDSVGSNGDRTSDAVIMDVPNQVINRVSSPISISKVHSNANEESSLQVVESLPNMMFDDDNLPLNAPHPFGRSLDSTLETFKMINDDVPIASGSSEGITSSRSQMSEEIKKILSDPAIEVSLCKSSLSEGMGYEAAARAFDAEKLEIEKFLSLDFDVLEFDKLVVRIGGLYFPWDAALPIASAIGSKEQGRILEPKGMIDVGKTDDRNSEGVSENSVNSRSGSWKIWPFSLKGSNRRQNSISSSEIVTQGPKDIVENADVAVNGVAKKKIRAKSPTSEQLASLNLKEGKNVVTFTFSTAMLGEQQVDARIFLWKWNARIVISDVDGTITKSDVLGQFMPLMGLDWSQTGVTNLFSAIKENGYQLLFLSARSISQAYHTRQFLFNLKQDGKALPEGPMLISPDGLFPSLYREVIRRAPHEFKIACLEDVKVLFPPDHHPFYAGFGNRDTDELSYLRVGIPRGKIFTINPKGQVVVNRRVDSKSYTSLHTLVHDMFPPTEVHEQEDYNSWNFWKLPPPDTII